MLVYLILNLPLFSGSVIRSLFPSLIHPFVHRNMLFVLEEI